MSTVPGKSTSGEDRNVTSTILGPNEHHERFSSLTKTTSSKQVQWFSGVNKAIQKGQSTHRSEGWALASTTKKVERRGGGKGGREEAKSSWS